MTGSAMVIHGRVPWRSSRAIEGPRGGSARKGWNQEMRDREKLLWSEMTREEKKLEKKEFLESFAQECGGEPKDYEMQWEQWLNQEGWTGRDERIMMLRDQLYEDKLKWIAQQSELPDGDHHDLGGES